MPERTAVLGADSDTLRVPYDRDARDADDSRQSHDTDGFVRLAPCPWCGGRRRILADAGNQLQGRCLACGEDLPAPLATERLAEALVEAPPGAGSHTMLLHAAPHCVLVVDDDSETRTLPLLSLASADYLVHSARDGHEGLRRFRQVSPAAVVSDIRVPGLDGFEMCRRIREKCSMQALPIISFVRLFNRPLVRQNRSHATGGVGAAQPGRGSRRR